MINAIGYIRVSSEKQVKEGQGLEVQKKSLLSYSLDNNIKLCKIFSDEGISGAEDLTKRKGLAEAINYIKENNINFLIIQKLDRLARDTMLLGYLEFELKKIKCQILATDQEFNKDPMGTLMKDIIVAFASFEKQMINLRTSSGKKNKVEKKLFTGGKVPFGYNLINSSFIEINKELQPIVKYIFSKRAKGLSLRKISNLIKDSFDFHLPFSSIGYIVKNPAYMGKYRQEKNIIIDIPPIISKSMFYKVNKK
ncbi:recombinase family protein [Cetobacterium sp. SF1]|uniref:recombinase family protein n=1 Tax=unclassified Cetobacterium TaxID=2630983 RepID=UPI003CE743DD